MYNIIKPKVWLFSKGPKTRLIIKIFVKIERFVRYNIKSKGKDIK